MVLEASDDTKTKAATVHVPSTFDVARSEEHTSELQSQSNLVCRLLLEKKKKHTRHRFTPIVTWPAHSASRCSIHPSYEPPPALSPLLPPIHTYSPLHRCTAAVSL